MVLEAWKNAEKISYPVIWETQKDASDVIDYNIREEITKDKSAEINANNDTTTGMATVIPWINEPQLLYDTSIHKYRIGEKSPSVAITATASSSSEAFSNFVYVATSDLDFWNNTSYLIVPVTWLYKMHFEWWDQQYWWSPHPSWTNTFTILKNWDINSWEVLAQETLAYRLKCTIDLEIVLYQNDILRFWEQNTTWWWWLWYCSATITKL